MICMGKYPGADQLSIDPNGTHHLDREESPVKYSITICTLFLVCSCAGNKIIIDRKGVNTAQYQQDLSECRQYADEIDTGVEVARGAARGAVVGGLIGAAVGNSRTAGKIGGAGAVRGASHGVSKAEHDKKRVVRNCLRGRGYKVLN